MRSAPTLAALMLAASLLVSPAVAFDVQHGGGAPASGGTANLAPDATSVPGVSIDSDLRAQLGLSEQKAAAESKSGLQFSAGAFGAAGMRNPTSLGYDESPWIAPRTRAGRD
jgi:hypothetical protein